MRLLDPSELYRPEAIYAGKPLNQFRDYDIDDEDPVRRRVRETYYKMHTFQTVDFVRGRMDHWLTFNHLKAPMMDVLMKLNELLDESDPDTDVPNIVHAFQTAERIRRAHPAEDWFHLVGLIHDAGKFMALFGEPQWAVVGDTFPVGCAWSDSIVYRSSSFEHNPDGKNNNYNTKYGIYQPNCGLDKVIMSWGHDEYMYRMLKHNNSTLPEKALTIIRYHSFYPWHASGDYMHLCNEEDEENLKLVQEFKKFDLYTKCDETPDIDDLTPYYQSLIDKYIPGELSW
ncbi:inositol oxygenase [Anabrus simplex]|uniref:inositol oxygenase n=1 Tax=Anabrus simplex TaxID=316456 RepID=UPI0034DCD08C